MATANIVSLTLEPLPACFGALATGLRLADLTDSSFEEIYAAWLEYGLLLFPDQHLTQDEQISFARRFGPLEFEFGRLSNMAADGSVVPPDSGADILKLLIGNMGWHQDSTYLPIQAKGGVLSAIVVPASGGETEFADMAAAYDALTKEEQTHIDGRTALHSIQYSQRRLGFEYETSSVYSYGMSEADVPCRNLVHIHPETGRRSLAIGRHAHAVSGLSEVDSEALLDLLLKEACRPPRIWTHRWSVGDVVAWDNRRVLHRALPWDMHEPRTMAASRIAGNPVTEGAIEVSS